MKKIGIILIIASFVLGVTSDYLPKEFPIEPIVALAFGYLLLGIYLLIQLGHYGFMRGVPNPPEHLRKGSVPKMKNPPPPPDTKCICNNIAYHSPGGKCEACHSIPPAISKESLRLSNENHIKAKKVLAKLNIKLQNKANCYLDCGNTRPSPGPDVICLNCGSSIIKPEFPKDRKDATFRA